MVIEGHGNIRMNFQSGRPGIFLEKGREKELVGQREMQMRTGQETGIPLHVPGSRESKTGKVKSLSGILRLANETKSYFS